MRKGWEPQVWGERRGEDGEHTEEVKSQRPCVRAPLLFFKTALTFGYAKS